MNDNDLFNSLDYDNNPGLGTVKSNFLANNINAAKAALANYYRTRTSVKYTFDPLHPNKSLVSSNTAVADAAVAGSITQVTLTYNFSSGLNIDWDTNPTGGNTGRPYDPEWQWQLNRMEFWPRLGDAWWATSKPIYSQTFVAQLKSFYTNEPRPCANLNNAQPSTWRTIECGIRTSSAWMYAYNRFLTSSDMTDDVIVNFVKLIADHGRHLLKWNTGGNWLTMEMNGLYTLGGMFPELSEAASWRNYAAQRLYNDMAVQLLDDGAHYELSTGYHQVFLDNMVGLYNSADLFSRLGELPADYLKALQNAYEYNVKIMQPNGLLPYFNDAWSVNIRSTSNAALKFFPSSALLKFAAQQQGAALPSFTSLYLANSGRAVMRTGWNTNDTFALLDVGPLGHNHVHQDKLHLVFSSFGRPLLWDGGGGQYEISKWRTYALSTYNHNTAVIDYLAQNRDPSSDNGMGSGNPATPAPVWKTTSAYDYTHGTYMDGYGSPGFTNTIATHHREVFFLKSFAALPVFIIVDRFIPNNANSHLYTVIWNFKTTNTTYDTSKKVLISQDPRVGNVAIFPISSVTNTAVSKHVAEDAALLWGWDISRESPYYNPATTVLHERNATGVQYFVTAMVALSPSSSFSPASFTVTSKGTQSYSVAFTSGPQIDIMLSSDSKVGGMQVTVGTDTYTTPNFGSSSTSSAPASTGPASTTDSTSSAPASTGSASTTGSTTSSAPASTGPASGTSTTNGDVSPASTTQITVLFAALSLFAVLL